VALCTSHSLVTKSDSRAHEHRVFITTVVLGACVYARGLLRCLWWKWLVLLAPKHFWCYPTASLESKLISLYRTVPVPRSSHHLEALGTCIHHPKAKRMSCPRTMTAVALTPDPLSRHRQDAAHTRFAVQPPRELYPPSPGLFSYLDR
jgi:hypothetical protein